MSAYWLALNKTNLEGIRPETGRVIVHDTKTPGLIVCVSAKGTKTFYRYGRVNRRPTRIKLGRYPHISIEQARRLCQTVTGQIANGEDPRAISSKKKKTLGELCQWYIDNYSKVHKKEWERDERRVRRHLSPWSHRLLGSITRSEIEELFASIGKSHGKYAANHFLQLLKHIFSRGIPDFIERNPADGIKPFTVHSRSRFLQPAEMGPFFSAIDKMKSKTMRDYMLTLLFCGARRHNVQSMQWSHLDLEAGRWDIPGDQFKNGESTTVYLSATALEILRERKAIADPNVPWVFPGKSGRGHLTEPKDAWRRIKEASGIENLRMHDLRRTLGSWQAAGGASLLVIGKSLGHRSMTATAIYARLQLDSVRESVDAATSAILDARDRSMPIRDVKVGQSEKK